MPNPEIYTTIKTKDMKTLNQLCDEIHENAKNKGFWDKERETGTRLMLCVSELAEAMEADRKGQYAKIDDAEFIIDSKTIREDLDLAVKENDTIKFEDIFRTQVKDTFEDELADTIIRILDLCGAKGIDIEKHIELKMKYNVTRERLHGKKY